MLPSKRVKNPGVDILLAFEMKSNALRALVLVAALAAMSVLGVYEPFSGEPHSRYGVGPPARPSCCSCIFPGELAARLRSQPLGGALRARRKLLQASTNPVQSAWLGTEASIVNQVGGFMHWVSDLMSFQFQRPRPRDGAPPAAGSPQGPNTQRQ